jgi:hypothetical protein
MGYRFVTDVREAGIAIRDGKGDRTGLSGKQGWFAWMPEANKQIKI